jgi:hypothetical protein
MNIEFKLITATDSIGDTLSAMNDNYNKLQGWFDSISLSANNYWKPLVDFYKNFSPRLLSNINLGFQKLPDWINTSTTVEQNSSKWIEPLIMYYPFVLTINQLNNISREYVNITNWLNSKFPVLNIGCPNGICYVENSQCIVQVMKQTSSFYENSVGGLSRGTLENLRSSPSDSTICTTSDTTASTGCSQCYSGSVGCGKSGTFGCGGCTSCSVTREVPCNFPETGTKIRINTITANIFYNYTDDYLDDFLRLNYKVLNCRWVLIGDI